MASAPHLLIALNALLLLGVVGALYPRHNDAAQLRQALATARQQAQAAAALEQENRNRRAGLSTSEALRRMQEEHAALSRLRLEVEELRRQAEQRLQRGARPSAEPPQPPAVWVEADWDNRGRDDPASTVITTLWAVTRGETARLAEAIQLRPEGQQRLQKLLDELPPELRASFSRPEELAAALATRDVAPASIEFLDPATESDKEHPHFKGLRIRVTDRATGQERFPTLATVRTDAGWKLIVPTTVLDRQLARLIETGESTAHR